jgi:hypothetical protein
MGAFWRDRLGELMLPLWRHGSGNSRNERLWNGAFGFKRTWASISAMCANDPLRKSAVPSILTTRRPKPTSSCLQAIGVPAHRAPQPAHTFRSQRTQQPQPISQRSDHLNCGIGGTDMRGGGSGATAGAFCTPIGPCICAEPIKAPLAANPAEPPAEPLANAAAGKARTTRIKTIFVAVLDIGSLHLNSLEQLEAPGVHLGRSAPSGIKFGVRCGRPTRRSQRIPDLHRSQKATPSIMLRISWVRTPGRRHGVHDFGVGLLAQAGARATQQESAGGSVPPRGRRIGCPEVRDAGARRTV